MVSCSTIMSHDHTFVHSAGVNGRHRQASRTEDGDT